MSDRILEADLSFKVESWSRSYDRIYFTAYLNDVQVESSDSLQDLIASLDNDLLSDSLVQEAVRNCKGTRDMCFEDGEEVEYYAG